jgi:hypothetical protein
MTDSKQTYPVPPGQTALVRGLIASLPPVGAEWPAEDREKWVATAMAAFDFLYRED